MKIPTDKPTVAVRLEGTVLTSTWEENTPNEDAIAKLRAQKDDLYIVIVTPLTQTYEGVRLVMDWLIRNDVPYDDLWSSPGIPDVENWWDNNAGML